MSAARSASWSPDSLIWYTVSFVSENSPQNPRSSTPKGPAGSRQKTGGGDRAGKDRRAPRAKPRGKPGQRQRSPRPKGGPTPKPPDRAPPHLLHYGPHRRAGTETRNLVGEVHLQRPVTIRASRDCLPGAPGVLVDGVPLPSDFGTLRLPT